MTIYGAAQQNTDADSDGYVTEEVRCAECHAVSTYRYHPNPLCSNGSGYARTRHKRSCTLR